MLETYSPLQSAVLSSVLSKMLTIEDVGVQAVSCVIDESTYTTIEAHVAKLLRREVALQLIQAVSSFDVEGFLLVGDERGSNEFHFQFITGLPLQAKSSQCGLVLVDFLTFKKDGETQRFVDGSKISLPGLGYELIFIS